MKIDTSKIEGYAEMSAEEKLAALEAYEMDTSAYVRKDVADKYASEAAKYKKELREKLSAEEQAKVEHEEAFKAMQSELETLRTEKAIDANTKKWMSLGYDEKLATETAKAMVSGDTEKVFANHAKFIADKEKNLRAQLLKDTPTPPSGEGNKGMTKEEFFKLSLVEKANFAKEQPERYKEFYKED